MVQAEGTSLAKQTSSNLVQKQSPEDINFTCVQSRKHPPSKALHTPLCLHHQRVHSHHGKPAPLSLSLSLSFPAPSLPEAPPFSPSSHCSRFTTLAWDGMRKHRPEIPLDPETSSCSWIYHTNKERRGKENAHLPPPNPKKKKNYYQKTCSSVAKCILTSKLALSLPFFFKRTLKASTSRRCPYFH